MAEPHPCTCYICDASFANRNAYKIHLQYFHGLSKEKVAEEILDQSSSRPLDPQECVTCNICDESFEDVKSYESHIREAHGLDQDQIPDEINYQVGILQQSEYPMTFHNPPSV